MSNVVELNQLMLSHLEVALGMSCKFLLRAYLLFFRRPLRHGNLPSLLYVFLDCLVA